MPERELADVIRLILLAVACAAFMFAAGGVTLDFVRKLKDRRLAQIHPSRGRRRGGRR